MLCGSVSPLCGGPPSLHMSVHSPSSTSSSECGKDMSIVSSGRDCIPQNLLCNGEPDSLINILKTLPVNDRPSLFHTLQGIHRQSHIYHNQWSLFEPDPELLERAIDLMRRYEANGLQLNGYGCWLFERIVVASRHRLDSSLVYPEDSILNLVLRILLEHTTHVSCVLILHEAIRQNPESFKKLCDIGVRIADELPQGIECDNFAALFLFVIDYLSVSWELTNAFKGIRLLATIAPRVETSPRAEYFICRAAEVFSRYIRENDDSDVARENPEESPRATLFHLLKALCPLHHSHVSKLHRSGFVDMAISYILSSVEGSATTDTDCCVSAMTFLCTACMEPQVLFAVIRSVSVRQLTELLSRDHGDMIVAITELYTATHGNCFRSTHTEDYDQEGIQLFVECFLDRAASILKDGKVSDSALAVFRSLRSLGRSLSTQTVLLSANMAARRKRVVELSRPYVEQCEGAGQGGTSELELACVLCMDALGVLSGWLDVCWEGIPVRDTFIDSLLQSTKEKFINMNANDSLPYQVEVEGQKHSVPVLHSLIPTPRHSLNSPSDSPDDDNIVLSLKSDDTINQGRDDICISDEHLSDFISEWEINSTFEVCQKVVAMVGVSRTQSHRVKGRGVEAVPGMDVEQLAEVLVELLTDERHDIHEVPGVREKCIQLLTDIASSSDKAKAVAVNSLDTILDIMGSWENWNDVHLMQSCFCAVTVLASLPECRRTILALLDKIEAVVLRAGSPLFIYAAIKLCKKLAPSINKISFDGETVVVAWVMRCVRSQCEPLVLVACDLLAEISLVHRPLIFKGFSRRELEVPIINLLKTSTDISTVLISLRTLALSAGNFNEKPFWYYDSWVHTWQSVDRELTSVDFMHLLVAVERKFQVPYSLVVLSYCLTILASLQEIPCVRSNEEYGLKFHSLFMPELAALIAVLTRSHDFISTTTMHHPTTETEDDSGEETIYGSLLATELHGINAAYELLGASAVQAIHSLVQFGGVSDISLYLQYEELFASTPICETIVYVMLQLPNNYTVQVKGMSSLQKLCEHGIGLRILGECCSKVLVGAMVSFNDDSTVHFAFCSIINKLAEKSNFERDRLIHSSVFKWLYIVIKAASPENAPLACRAVTMISDTQERAEAMGNAGISRYVLLLLDKHTAILKVQMEGLRTVVALCKSSVCYKQIKSAGGEKRIQRARAFLRNILAGSSDERALPILDQSIYTREDIVELLESSAPRRMSDKCLVS
mmetsp:Transcript_22438/g.32725  ORF Transcript_22438/g.32725 Transcript_22438/m.32725 type:complete len:1238 (+) Transcript_22438:101-3814(+)